MKSLVIFIGLLAACGGTNPSQPLVQVVSSLNVLAGEGQSDTVTHTLATPIEVQAKDVLDAPIAGVALNWIAVPECICNEPDTIRLGVGVTDVAGIGRYRWTLPTQAREWALIAWAIDADGSRVIHTKVLAQALPDRVVWISTALVQTKPEAFFLLRDYAWGMDRYGNNAGTPGFDTLPEGWRSSADTVWTSAAAGEYILPLVFGEARGLLTVQVQ